MAVRLPFSQTLELQAVDKLSGFFKGTELSIPLLRLATGWEVKYDDWP